MITLQYNLNHVIMFFGNVMDRNYDVIIFISKYLYFNKVWGKVVTMFIKTIIKDSRKVKIIRSYISKCNLYLYVLM